LAKAIRTFYTQDQASKKPLLLWLPTPAPLSPRSPTGWPTLTRDILGRDFLMVADKEWYCGQLIQELHAQLWRCGPDPVKSSPKRLEEFDTVPLEQYDQTIWGNVAAVYTTMTDFDGPLRMLLKKRRNGTYFALITPAHALTAATAMPTYTKRWRIEKLFRRERLPGSEPPAFLHLNASRPCCLCVSSPSM